MYHEEHVLYLVCFKKQSTQSQQKQTNNLIQKSPNGNKKQKEQYWRVQTSFQSMFHPTHKYTHCHKVSEKTATHHLVCIAYETYLQLTAPRVSNMYAYVYIYIHKNICIYVCVHIHI